MSGGNCSLRRLGYLWEARSSASVDRSTFALIGEACFSSTVNVGLGCVNNFVLETNSYDCYLWTDFASRPVEAPEGNPGPEHEGHGREYLQEYN